MHKKNGFTLIELMVTIGVLAIVATLAAPSFGNLMNQQKLKTNVMDLKSQLQLARSQALLTRAATVVCINKSNTDGDITSTTCAQKLPGFGSLSTALKSSNVFIVERDNKVVFDASIKDDFFIFNNLGKTSSKKVKLCSGSKSYTLTLSAAGTVETESGDAC
ncbi:GspH/FimT family pseudopilin [Acinetobacter sp. A2]|uniref:GspH/FimT family pseudopilin n=1 Tax=Acinetobacter sp. A2 TaxID=362457 RepID=UPI003AF3A050